ncbi:uncharacterized protein LOC131322981 isoform X1 [Rhododendron vialii]|uniref:uncharacterized protein LOC131322981 isoform X1 n=1 Tax=Rhododendron vialii TaxID=182163 RepID=UPI00265EAC02|nr:uncharacterized protein LOC131322981 isoform X1 [Rhododendron vialii]
MNLPLRLVLISRKDIRMLMVPPAFAAKSCLFFMVFDKSTKRVLVLISTRIVICGSLKCYTVGIFGTSFNFVVSTFSSSQFLCAVSQVKLKLQLLFLEKSERE